MSDAPDAAPPEAEPEVPLALPEDAAGWRALIAAIPARTLLRDINANKAYSRIIFQGFRGGVEVLKNPIVQSRLVELAQKNATLANLLALSAQLSGAVAEAQAELFPKEPAQPASPAPDPVEPKGDAKLKERVKEQRAAILQKEARIKDLEAQLQTLSRERESSRAEIEAERKARKEAEAAAERERRQRERDSRKAVKPAEVPVTASKIVTVSVAPAPAAPPIPAAFDEAMRRVLNRGKYAAAAEVCRELLATEGLESGSRGAVHRLFADALYGQSLDAEGEEQDRLAVGAFLDAGQVLPATEALGRLLSHGPSVPLKAPELALLQRLLALTQKRGLMDDVQKTLSRLRVTAPTGYARLRIALQEGRKHAPLLKVLAETAAAGAVRVTSDETVALPVSGRTAATVTARRLLQAVESGDENFVTCARDGIETLRESNAALADALLEAVAALHPLAGLPLTNPLPRSVVVDASNVARYNPDPLAAYSPTPPPPSTGNLLAMRDFLWKRGYFPVLLVADANLRYHVDDKKAYVALVERGIVREVGGGTSADEKLLAEARGHVAPLVSNDRFAEFADAVKRVERVAFEIYPGGVVILNPL